MKSKFARILGVALPFMMVLALAVALLPAATNAPSAEAAIERLRFSRIPLMKFDADGKYVLTPNVCPDVGPVAISHTGSVLFAAENKTSPKMFKSTDSGYTWTKQDGFRTEADNKSDTAAVVGIKLSPEYSSDTTVFVATLNRVYQSVDAGKTFSAMDQPATWDASESISDMDLALDKGGRLSVIIGSTGNVTAADVYVYSPATTGMSWKEQLIDDAAVSYNVLGVAFSPNYAVDEGIFAVTTDNNTTVQTLIQSAFGYTKDGEGWDASIGDGEFLDRDGIDIPTASRARIAFPDDFDVDSTISNVAFVGLKAGTSDGLNTNEKGDVYRITFQPSKSSTVDLNVRGLISARRTATNIWSLDVAGDAESASIVAGTDWWSTGATNYYWTAYYSNDSGESWSTPREKAPTGGTRTDTTNAEGTNVQCNVLLAPDFVTSGVAYAATSGSKTSAFSRTGDGGKSWNQISLMDYANTADNYSVGKMQFRSVDWFYMITTVGTPKEPALWQTTNGGANYERIWSRANPNVTDTLDYCYITKENTIFAIDRPDARMWRSSDDGATFPRRVTAKNPDGNGIKVIRIEDPNTIFTGYKDGSFWYTTTLGRPWIEPEESEIEGEIVQINAKGDHYQASTKDGKTFFSADRCETFKRLGVSDPNSGLNVRCTWDKNYSTNHYFYQIGRKVGQGVYRTEIDPDDPGAAEWRQIDGNSDGVATVYPYVISMRSPNMLWVFDNAVVNVAANATAGGIWRCLNPEADIDGIYPPEFTKVVRGLADGDKVGYKHVLSKPNEIALVYNSSAVYYDALLGFSDTLSSAPALVGPADKATGAGFSLSTTDLTMVVNLEWSAVPGATYYKYQVANDADFESIAVQGTIEGQEIRVENLTPGKKYYWRVRVENPLLSPWSDGRSFSLGTAVEFGLVSPEIGATGVSIMPTFTWSEFEGAIGYEIMVAEDSTFAIIDFSRSVDMTFFKSEEALAYDTTYYWRVRGVTGPAPAKKAAPGGPWEAGVFTTEAKAVEAAPPVVVQPPPPTEVQVVQVPVAQPTPIPSYLLWMIIGIGAVLFIALIVLIVRTRRVA